MANDERDSRGRFKVNEKLTPIQLDMITELLNNGGNKTEACKTLGVPRATLYTWIDNEIWQEEYRRACERVYKIGLSKYINKLDKILDSKDSRTVMKAIENGLKLNGYLGTNLDVSQNTTENITIRIVSEDNEEE
ncbi:MAG: helix-turn-helix domain-containing protein [Lachnospiraceae bacterium]|nr:helix-turn-helix domain-containing protein [Lachnospiraceae bacterium]